MGKIRILKEAEPATPPLGRTWLYTDESDNHLKTKNDSGAVVDLTATAAYDDTAVIAAIDNNAAGILGNAYTIDNLAKTVANLSTAQCQIHQDSATTVTTTPQVLTFTTDIGSTDDSIFSIDAAANTFTFHKDASYNFSSTITFESATPTARTIYFDLINTAEDSIIATESVVMDTANGSTEVGAMITLLTLGRNGMPSAPLTMQVQVRASGTGYSIPEFHSILASSTAYGAAIDKVTNTLTATGAASTAYAVNLVDVSTNSVITLPTAVGNDGQMVRVKRIDSTASTVTIDTLNSETIDGVLSTTLAPNGSINFIANGFNWFTV